MKYNIKWLLCALLGFICVAAAFFVPYLFPYEAISNSMSYDFGFNNTVALAIVCLSIVFYLFIGYRWGGAPVHLFAGKSNNQPLLLTSLAGIYLFCMVAVIFTEGDYALGNGESPWFVKYQYALEAGKKPYEDFLWGYGPAVLYFPFWLHRVFGLSFVASHNVCVMLFHLLGILCVYDIIMRLNVTGKIRNSLFFFVWLTMFMSAVGGNIHYQLLRFALPVWLIVRIMVNHTEGHKKNFWWQMPVAVVLMLLSAPELAVTFFVAGVLSLSALLWLIRDRSIVLELMLTIVVMVGVNIFIPELFDFMKIFSGGFYNIPFTLNIVLLVFLAAVLVISYNAGQLCKDLKANIVGLSMIVTMFGMLPACLGRCDAGHLIFNGLFIVVIAFVILYNKIANKRIRLMLLFGVFLMYFSPYCYKGAILHNYFTHANALVKNNWNFFKRYAATSTTISHLYRTPMNFQLPKSEGKVDYPIDLSNVDRVSMLSANYNIDLYCYLERDGKYQDLYITYPYISAQSIERTIEDLENREVNYLLLKEGWDKRRTDEELQREYDDFVTDILRGWYPVKIKHNHEIMKEPLERYIKNCYDVVDEGNGYQLYKRRTS